MVEEYYSLRIRDINASLSGLNELVRISSTLTNEDRMFVALNRYAEVLMIAGNHVQAESIANRVHNHFTTEENLFERAKALYTLGSIEYKSMKHFDGLQKLTKCKAYFEELNCPKEHSKALKAIGYINEIFGSEDTALKIYHQCIDISSKENDPFGLSNALIGASKVYVRQGEMETAENYLGRAIQLKKMSGDLRGLAWAYCAKAEMLLSQTKSGPSHDYALQAHDVFKQIGEPFGLVKNLNLLGIIHLKKRSFSEANSFFQEAVEAGLRIQCVEQLTSSYDYLYQIAKYLGDYKVALAYHEKHLLYRENKIEQENEAALKSASFKFEKEYNRQQKQQDEERMEELRELSRNLTEKNQDITDSLRYASRIQQAVLPSESTLNTLFRDSFIFYRPRDIVSGDFYWFGEHERKIFIAVCDCTGHGVPAAFMSLIGHNLLNEIVVKESIFRPAQVLHSMRSKLVKHLKQDSLTDGGTDGIAISAICVDKENLLLEYSGSFQPIHIVRGDNLYEMQPDKIHVGGYVPSPSDVFENKCFQLEHGDAIYMQSDGLKDQFGGPKNKKLKTEALLHLIKSLAPEKMSIQNSLLTKYMDEWRDKNPQVDDMLLIGLRV